MMRLHTLTTPLALLAWLALASCASTPWLSLPAAGCLLLWLPGYFVLRLLPEIRSSAGRWCSAAAASCVLMPVPLWWLWQATHSRFAVLGAVVAIDILLACLGSRVGCQIPATASPIKGRVGLLFVGMACWTAVCVFASFWLPTAAGRVATPAAHDYVKHHAVLLSLERHPLPLHNIFYAAEANTPYYYYEYHYLLPAALRAMTGHRVSIAFAFGLTSAVTAVACMAMVFFLAWDWFASARAATLAAACVSLVGGWDAIPIAARVLAGGSFAVTLDAWCPVAWRVHNIATQYLWCPQHVSALIALLVCCRWLHRAPTARWWLVVAPFFGAFVFGSSAYLAMTMFPAAAIYALVAWRRATRSDARAGRRLLLGIALIAVIGAVLMGVQACHYAIMNSRFPGGLTLQWERFPFAVLGRLVGPGPMANLLDAPWVILIECGLTAVACVLVSRRVWSILWHDGGGSLLLVTGGVGIVLLLTVRSDVNRIDYGFRIAVMPAMALAAICAGALLMPENVRRCATKRIGLVVTLGVLLGLPVGLWEVPMTAVRSLLETPAFAPDAGAIRFLRDNTPVDAVVQGDPVARMTLPQLVDRQIGVLDPDNAHFRVFWPKDEARLRAAFADVKDAWSSTSGEAAYANLASWGVTHVLVGSVERRHLAAMNPFADPAWFEPVFDDGDAAVYRLTSQPDAISLWKDAAVDDSVKPLRTGGSAAPEATFVP